MNIFQFNSMKQKAIQEVQDKFEYVVDNYCKDHIIMEDYDAGYQDGLNDAFKILEQIINKEK
tara:strand:+ start:563 stop:748 length:186 start_codon:yes stop_codon:yes gene_type:complete